MAPVYEFENKSGERLEHFFPVREAPSIGSWVKIDGHAWRRVIEAPQIPSSKGQENYRLHSEACPNLAAIEHAERKARHLQSKGHAVRMPVRAPAYDEVGRAVFKSPKELHDYCERDGRFKVGNPKEIAAQHVAHTHEVRKDAELGVKYRDRLANLPEVQ